MRVAARWGMTTLGAAMLLGSASPARAADKTTAEAEARFQEGLARVKSRDFEAARLSFAQAYAVLKRPLILWNLALAEEKTGYLVDALQHFRRVAEEAEAEADRASAQRHVDELMTQTGHIDVKAPPGARIAVDSGPAWTAPVEIPIDVVPGRHVVDADVTVGPRSVPVEVAGGQLVHVTFSQAEAPPAPTPPSPVTAAPAVLETSVAPRASETPTPTPSSGPFWTPGTVTSAALGGAALIAFGLGIYFGVESRDEASAVSSYRSVYPSDACAAPGPTLVSTCAQWNDDHQAQNRDAAISDVAYVAGGVLAAAAVATWFLWPRDTRGTGAWVLPEAGRSTAGLAAGASF